MTRNNDTTDTEYTSLPDVDPPPVVDRLRHDIREEFYEPCLSVAETYSRGVGYFTTRWFTETADGMSSFVANGGTARWVISPVLTQADYDALRNGYDARTDKDAVVDIVRSQLDDLQSELEADTRNTVGWLVADGIVDIKIAVPTEFDDAIYHDKFGIIEDGDGNRLSFHGSMNDTGRAYRNIEAYTVDCDWYGERDVATVNDHETRFEQLWNDDLPGISTMSLPEAAEQGLLDLRTTDCPPYHTTVSDGGEHEGQTTATTGDDTEGEDTDADLRETVTLRDYQEEAIEAWLENDHRGTLEMATGLGKTITAEAAIDQFTKPLDQNVLVVIAVPENYLGRQWAKDLTEWGFDDPVMAYGSENHRWAADLSTLVTDTELGIVSPGIAITTHDSFHKDGFLKHIERASVPCMLVVDEVHGVGTETRQKGLDDAYAARLGLSATPERYMDPSGTVALESYFEGTVYEYGLEEGIPEYLASYEYHPVVVELTEEEVTEYIDESQRLAATIGAEGASDEDVSRIAQQRAEITKTAERKHDALQRILADLETPEGLIVFAHHEQMGLVTDKLHDQEIKYHQFTQEESPDQREQLIDSFGRDDRGLDALVGIHCLDEGVDVSSAQTAVLMASTGNPRQFVQRRGRVLRQHDDKDMAHIFDLIVVPPRTHFEDLLESEQSLLVNQLDRHAEFAKTAANDEVATAIVSELRAALEE